MNEKIKILKMLEQGKINAEEAAKLLAALGQGKKKDISSVPAGVLSGDLKGGLPGAETKVEKSKPPKSNLIQWPDGWESLNKNGLIKLAKEHAIDFRGNKKDIIARLKQAGGIK